MKKTVEFTIENKTYELMFNIKSLALLERKLNKSITYLFAAGAKELVKQIDIGFTVSALQVGLNLSSVDEAYTVVENFCADGNDIDQMNAYIIQAVIATGLFTRGVAQTKQEETAPKTKAKKTK